MPYYHQPDHILKSEDCHKSFLQSMRKHQIPGIALALITNGKISTFEKRSKESAGPFRVPFIKASRGAAGLSQ